MFVLLYALGFILSLRPVVYLICSFFDIVHRRRRSSMIKDLDPRDMNLPLVSILVPAYNEERVIRGTVASVLKSDYPNIEIIIIDDGSTDDTYAVASALATEDDCIFAIPQRPNRGKAEALNTGLKSARGDFLVTIDADTIVASDMVRLLVGPLVRDESDAVASNLKVGNCTNLVTRWQSLEYVTGLNFDRRAQARLGTITTIPGCAGSFRRSAVTMIGGYSSDTMVEDTDLTLAMLCAGFCVEYEPRANAFTEAPATWFDLTLQRTRWGHGYIQCIWKYRHIFLRHGVVGWVAMPDLLFVHILFHPLLLASMHSFLYFATSITGKRLSLVGLQGTGLDLLLTMFYLWLDKDELSNMMYVIPRRIVWPFFSFFIFGRVCFKGLTRTTVGWNKLSRTGELADLALSSKKPCIVSNRHDK